ncbi:dethiobiotin synthase [Desulfolucanica intricata]|uniref:dethiobiotin synthase n=1 Tax=Desulfolucanica intricata TaxID=1285191 RepID=UPI002378CE36|nr:dethiobiotin synthase [Desulfolucanica intricata]
MTGTDTGVGKTVVTAGLTSVLRKNGIKALAVKPVQTGGLQRDGRLVSEDALFFKRSAALEHAPEELTFYCLAEPLSPHLAAWRSGIKIDPKVIAEGCKRLSKEYEVLLIEGAGGFCVPLEDTFFTFADLVKMLDIPLIVVARPGLGTINHTVLTVRYAQMLGIEVRGIIFNGLKKEQVTVSEINNPETIAAMTGVRVCGILPFIAGLSMEKGEPAGLTEQVEKYIDWQVIFERK